MLKRKLACSFCGKREDEVAKLAAGPRVFICDACVAEAQRVMNDPSAGAAVAASRPTVWGRIRRLFGPRSGPTLATGI